MIILKIITCAFSMGFLLDEYFELGRFFGMADF